jgi:hypothetical protein
MLLILHEITHFTNVTPLTQTLLWHLESAFLHVAKPSTRREKCARACGGKEGTLPRIRECGLNR